MDVNGVYKATNITGGPHPVTFTDLPAAPQSRQLPLLTFDFHTSMTDVVSPTP